MRVIHLIGGGDTGGAKTHVLNLLKELNQSIDAQLFCFRRGEFSDDAEKMGIPIQVIESGNPVVGLQELKRLLAGQQVDIIHCHGARGNLMGNLVKKHLKAPVVTTVHSDYRLDYMGRPVAMLSYGATNMVALRQMNFYIGVSDPMTDILIERGFPADRIYTIYNGIDFKTPIHPAPKEEFLKSVGMEWGRGGRDRRHRRPAVPGQGHPHPAAGHGAGLQGKPPPETFDRRGRRGPAETGKHGPGPGACGQGLLRRVALRCELLLQRHRHQPFDLYLRDLSLLPDRGHPDAPGHHCLPCGGRTGAHRRRDQRLHLRAGGRKAAGPAPGDLGRRRGAAPRLWGAHLRKSQPGVLHRPDGGTPAGDLREHSQTGRPAKEPEAGRGHHLRGLRPRQRRGRRHFEIHHPVGEGAGRLHACHGAGKKIPRA